MKQENKDLLLRDLCARLPYRIKIQVKDRTTLETELKVEHIKRLQNEDLELKPFLRPLSSLTRKEVDELDILTYECNCVLSTSCFPIRYNARFKTYSLEVIEWLNKHHFDYRDLIEKGLALKAPKGMYNFD